MTEDLIWKRAAALAKKGELTCAPNPMVGAVIMRGSKIIGEGYHQTAGQDHAEIRAIKDAKKKGYDVKGATIYVTLEPCSTYGKTPPCTDALIKNQLGEVKIGTLDPNPAHRGRAVEILKKAGIKVSVENIEECRDLNEAFNFRMEKGCPFVHLKWAMSADGKIACENGESKWISSLKSRQEAHKLRARYNAVLVGSKTVEKDDPSLSIRLAKSERQPYKIVLDSKARLSYAGRIAENTPPEKIVVAVASLAPEDRVKKLEEKGFTVIKTKGEKVDLKELLKALAKLSISGILVEGGGEVQSAFMKARLANKLTVFVAPLLLGGSKVPFTQALSLTPSSGVKINWTAIKRSGEDVVLEGSF